MDFHVSQIDQTVGLFQGTPLLQLRANAPHSKFLFFQASQNLPQAKTNSLQFKLSELVGPMPSVRFKLPGFEIEGNLS